MGGSLKIRLDRAAALRSKARVDEGEAWIRWDGETVEEVVVRMTLAERTSRVARNPQMNRALHVRGQPCRVVACSP